MKTKKTTRSTKTRRAHDLEEVHLQVLEAAANVLIDCDYTDVAAQDEPLMKRLAMSFLPEQDARALVFQRFHSQHILDALLRVHADIVNDIADWGHQEDYVLARRADLVAIQDQLLLTANVLRKDGAR